MEPVVQGTLELEQPPDSSALPALNTGVTTWRGDKMQRRNDGSVVKVFGVVKRMPSHFRLA
jgi:hypothetical protein